MENGLYKAGVAGIHAVGTVPEARRQGIGSALTLEPLLVARREGYRIGVLFSEEMAVNIYRTLGFKEYCQGNLYLWMGESE
ncbi:MAG: GNAT family N-acetyltransferase [Chloroflexi bacterium]|nr:GNAT family N-acetyltransferase [Chloroflexota bacterium]MDA1219567.1 GNAT family N-acetyltransferase [Chloroflexota bacterium]